MIPLHKVFMPVDMEPMMSELRRVLASGWIGEGPQVAKLESEFRTILGSDNVAAVNSCTAALTLALRIAGVGPGDEVISTAATCTATNIPIILAGAKIVWADVDRYTGNISPESIANRITPKTKALMAVHWGGAPCEMQAISAIAQPSGIKVIEDAAHALGSKYKGEPIGCHSDFVTFSLQSIKHVTAGDGGILVSRSMVDFARSKSLRWFGIDRENRKENALGYAEWNVVEPGFKAHLNDIAATVCLAQLPHLPDILAARRANALAFNEAFADLKRIKACPVDAGNESAYWLYTVLLTDDNAQVAFIRYLKENGIAASVVHMRNDKGAVFAPYRRDDLPGLDHFASHMVCIPVGQWVGNAERDHIIDVIGREAW